MSLNFLSRFDAYHEQAIQATGLSDFGLTDYVEPMKLLLADYDKYCPHTPEGDVISNSGLVGQLVARLFAQKGFKEHPELADAKIEKPIIITGMPRTGSTALQKLLTRDPGMQWLPPWLASAPMPRPPRESWESNPVFQAGAQGIEQIYQMVPELRIMHPMVPGEADECRFAMSASFWSPDLACLGSTNGQYAEWLNNAAPRYAYGYYRKVLALIAGGDKRQWILKDPTTHPFAPRTMLETFPDARIVYTHRDPISAMSSVADMSYWARRLRIIGLTPERNGRDQLAFWAPIAEKLEKVVVELDPSRVIHVHMNDLHVNPVGTVEKIYHHFGIPVTDAARQAWRHLVETNPRSGHGTHHHQVENSGFSAADVLAAMPTYWAGYLKRFGAAT